MSKTATEIVSDARALEIARERFKINIEKFVRRWGPEDLRDAAHFQGDLTGLLMDMHMGAHVAFAQTIIKTDELMPSTIMETFQRHHMNQFASAAVKK